MGSERRLEQNQPKQNEVHTKPTKSGKKVKELFLQAGPKRLSFTQLNGASLRKGFSKQNHKTEKCPKMSLFSAGAARSRVLNERQHIYSATVRCSEQGGWTSN